MNLQHMYQAWLQGRPGYVGDWASFVDFAAKQTNTTFELMLNELEKYRWFIREA